MLSEGHDSKACGECGNRFLNVEARLEKWSVYTADARHRDVLPPQDAETHVCAWLKRTAYYTGLANNTSRLFGSIQFLRSGNICDFEISPLTYDMLNPGFKRWMNTLASGELLLHFINSMLALVPLHEREAALQAVNAEVLPVHRMVDTTPGFIANAHFLCNHNVLMDEFLLPIATWSQTQAEHTNSARRWPPNLQQTLQGIRHYAHQLLRCRYTIEIQETWKCLMLVVLTVMGLCGCLTSQLQALLHRLTGTRSSVNYAVPQLCSAYAKLQASRQMTPLVEESMDLGAKSSPFARVLKQGTFGFDSCFAEH